MPETLTEIRQHEDKRRALAYQFETLTNDRTDVKKRISKLEDGVPNTKALRQIIELTAEIPADIVTRGTPGMITVPGGLVARDFIQMVARGALADALNRDERRKARLAELKAKLALIDNALKEFD